MTDEQQQSFSPQALDKFRQWHFWWLVVFSFLMVVIFVWYLPTRFLYQNGVSVGGHDDHGISTDIHDHGGTGALNIPLGLNGALVQDNGTVLTANGDNAGGAHVTAEGQIMLGSGEILEGAHVMPDNTVMVMQSVSSGDVSSLPKRGPADRVDELSYVIKNGVKEFYLTVDEFQWEWQPGSYVHAWGYNGQIPGPTIRVNEGDKVRVIVNNNLPDDSTSVHWHGQRLGEGNWSSDGVPGLTQESIKPGSEFIYEFDAISIGTRWYHSHGQNHITVAQQVDMGLSGVFITEPRVPTVVYDKEYVLLLDEWDILPGGVNPAYGHVHGAAVPGAVPEFNTFTINGRVFPYIDSIKVKEGERVLIRIVNGGTSAFHPMHTHGHDFELVALDGNPVPRSAIQERNVYTVHPGETADFLLTANNPGNWLFHCHHAHHAAAGMIMLVEYEGFAAPTIEDLRMMAGQAVEYEGLHIMSDGIVMLGNGNVLEDATVTDAGLVRLNNGIELVPMMDMREAGSMEDIEHEHDDGTMHDHIATVSAGPSYIEESSVNNGPVVNLNAYPVPYKTGSPIKLDFLVNRRPSGDAISISQLDVVHEKQMHVLGVRSDLSEFFHIHPVETKTPGLLSVEYTFDKSGLYKIWSDIAIDGNPYIFGHPELNITGDSQTDEKKISFARNVITGDYQVSLISSDTVVQGREVGLSFDVHSLIGQEITVENYLGAQMHLAIIKDDLSQFIHAHPEDGDHMHAQIPRLVQVAEAQEDDGHDHDHNETSGGDEVINFNIVFPSGGVYKAFAQFRPQGIDLPIDEAIIAEFWIQVEEKSSLPISPWWLLFIVSAILTTVLSFAVKRYLVVKPKDVTVSK